MRVGKSREHLVLRHQAVPVILVSLSWLGWMDDGNIQHLASTALVGNPEDVVVRIKP